MAEAHSDNDHFVNKDASVRALYDQLIALLRTFGPVQEDPKKTSIHLNRKSALAGVETRKNGLLLNIKLSTQSKARASKRFHHKVRMTSPNDLDEEQKTWLKEASLLSG